MTGSNTFLDHAFQDVYAIEGLAASIDINANTICYLSQQVAEKIVKSVFLAHGMVPERTHKIEVLLGSLEKALDITFSETTWQDAIELSRYEASARYDEDGFYTEQDAKEAVRLCNAIADVVEGMGSPAVTVDLERQSNLAAKRAEILAEEKLD